MKRMLVCLALVAALFTARAQTTITIPTTVQMSNVQRPGITLSGNGESYYGNLQIDSNLLSGMGYMPPLTWQSTSSAASCTTTTWTDNNTGDPKPANFWAGATYQIVSGTNIGVTGTVTASTAVSGGTGIVFTLSGTFGSNICVSGDVMIIRQRTPSNSWLGQPTPSQVSGALLWLSGSGTSSFNYSDVSASSLQPRSLELGGLETVFWGFDTDYGSPARSSIPWINLNGTYTLTFRMKALVAQTVTVSVSHSGNTYVTQNVTPTVNTTPGAGWQNYSYQFTASETGPPTNTGLVTFTPSNSGGTVLLQDVVLQESQPGTNPTVLRNAVFQKLKAYNPGVIRFMDLSTWGCQIDTLMTASGARSACGYSIYEDTQGQADFGLNDELEIANAVGAAPWFTMSFASTTQDYINTVEFLAGGCGTTYGAKR